MVDVMANQAFVLMLCGLTTRWKQVVAYYFTGDSFNAVQIKQIIIVIIEKAHESNLKVMNITMDIRGGNQVILRKFGISCKFSKKYEQLVLSNSCSHPVVENMQLTFMPDVLHLLKYIRNHLNRKQVIYLPDYVVRDNNLPSNAVTIRFVKELVDHD